jgi:alkylation response protein AidB-like acyl-CoA dehydrogenase
MPPASQVRREIIAAMTADPLLEARRLAAQAREAAAQAERDRRLPADLVEAIAAAGLFRMLVPAELAGGEVTPAQMVGAVEALAYGDGAAGWCLAVAATSGMLAAYLPGEHAREVYGDPGSVAGGVFAPKGRAVAGPDGLRASGRWAFASGCEHCDWLMGGCFVERDGEVVKLESGAPDVRLLLFPAAEVQIVDTWNVAGLRGTGSHDFEVTDALVPEGRAASLISDPPRAAGPLYAFPIFGLLALSIAAVGLGIARAAIAELAEISGARKPSGSKRTLAERPEAQARVARHEAGLAAARALIDARVEAAWIAANEAGEVSVQARAGLRAAATHAIEAARDVTVAMYELGGGAAIYESSPLQRRLRDVHVATQHMLVAPSTWELAGRSLLGQPLDAAQV